MDSINQPIAPNFKATIAATQLESFRTPFRDFSKVHVEILKKDKDFKRAFDSIKQNKEKIYSENLATLNKILDEVIAEHLKSNNGEFSDAKIYEELRNRLMPRIKSMADSEDDFKIEEIRSELEKLTLSELGYIKNENQSPTNGFALKEESLSIEVETMNEKTICNEAETTNSNISQNDKAQFLVTSKSVIPMRRGIALKKDLITSVIEEQNVFNFVKDNVSVRTRDFELFTLSGQICAIDRENNAILQTRTRQKDTSLQSGDKFQILANLCISQCHKCLFAVQSGDGKITYETVEFDDQLFREVCQNINAFVKKARTLTLDDLSKIIG